MGCGVNVDGWMFKRIGFFHFVKNHHDPFGSFAKALEDKYPGDISSSLIVLPEAFNLGKPYHHPNAPTTSWALGGAKVPLPVALQQLQYTATTRKVVFVAGLVGEQFTSAYWIDHQGPALLMCHKLSEDYSGNYKPWSPSDDNRADNPIDRYGACVGSLVCLDALEEQQAHVVKSREDLIKEMRKRNQVHRILCVPMCKGSRWNSDSPPDGRRHLLCRCGLTHA